MMSSMDLSKVLLAACGGDTVKLFDISVKPNDPCTLSYSPSPGSQVNSIKWNHTNLVVASAGDDKKISLQRKNGDNMGPIPLCGSDIRDIDESISAISFTNKSSRYLCSGGSGQVVRVWDLQRKRCIKWLRGHTDTITGVMCNCKDEYLASISLKGDLILHKLDSGAQTAELKDPNEQVLRVLDYSRTSRHVLVTAGDDGSVHLWDTTGRSPKVSWLKLHSAPTTGVCFSPSNDKIIASAGLDKKLYTFDSGTRRPTFCIPYEAPFSSLAFRDDGWILAAGTNSGRVVFYDVRGKPQPFTVLRAYNSSEAVTSLCWQRSKPMIVNENTCTSEVALLGVTGEDSILMPDPLPSVISSGLSSATAITGSRNSVHSSVDSSPLTVTNSGSIQTTSYLSTAEETPNWNHLRTGGLSRLQATRAIHDFNDDMEVFSPLVDVQPITPSLSNCWRDPEEGRRVHLDVDKNSGFPSSIRRYPHPDQGNADLHPISDWKSSSSLRQEDTQSMSSQGDATPATSLKPEQSFSPTPPEAWGGNPLSDKFSQHCQTLSKPSWFMPGGSLVSSGLLSGSIFAGVRDSSGSTSNTSLSSLTTTSLYAANLHSKDVSNRENHSGYPEASHFGSVSTSVGTKTVAGQANTDLSGSVTLALPRRSYAERMSTVSSFNDGGSPVSGSPKPKKTGAETREDVISSLLARVDTSVAMGMGFLPTMNGSTSQSQRDFAQLDQQQGTSSFTLQLFQRTLDESLATVQKSLHEENRNIHIELLRQFHIQETRMSTLLTLVLEKQDELMKEVQSLRKENQQLRQML